MPWTLKDVESHKSGLTKKQKEVWITIANDVRQKCIEKGGDEKTCDISAIKQANNVASKALYNDVLESIEYDDDDNIIVTFCTDENPFIFEEIDKEFYETEMEVFASGIHNGDKYKNKDLDAMIEAFNTLKNKWKPTLKIGHGKQLSEQPALGYVEKLKRVGDKLIASIVNIPKIVKQAMEKGLYRKRSAEIYWNYKDGNKVWARCLKAIALLGENIPAVSSLKDIEKFFDEGEGDVKAYELDLNVNTIDINDDENYKEVKDYLYWSEDRSTIKAKVREMDVFFFPTLNKIKFEEKEGVSIIIGALSDKSDDPSIIQCWEFDRNVWTLAEARKWLEGSPYDLSTQPELASRYAKKVTKTEDGIEFPKEAYLYVPDAEKSSTWKLRIWEDLETKVTKTQLGRAAAAFSPGGFRGNKVELPPEDVKGVKDKLKSLYKELGVENKDMPKYLNETKEVHNMDWEAKVKELQVKIDAMTTKIAEYEADEKTKEVEELTAQLQGKEVELTEMKAFKMEADKLKRERDDAMARADAVQEERRNDSIATFVKDNGVSGTKRILPKNEQLVMDILKACPQEKKYKLDDKDASLEDMVKKFVESLPEMVDTKQHSHKDKDTEFDKASFELEARIKEYCEKNPDAKYVTAYEHILASDKDLKERLHKERM